MKADHGWHTGVETYVDNRAHSQFYFLGLLPSMSANGDETSRSQNGRLAIEMIYCPASLLPRPGVEWTDVDHERARATVRINGEFVPITITVNSDGSLREVSVRRFDPHARAGAHAHVPFGAVLASERTFDGYTIPVDAYYSWLYGSAKTRKNMAGFDRTTISDAVFS